MFRNPDDISQAIKNGEILDVIIPYFKENPEFLTDPMIQGVLPEVTKAVVEGLWEDWWSELIPQIGNIPFFSENPEIRVIVGYLCHMYGKLVHRDVRKSPEWMSKSIILAALGESLVSVPDSTYAQEIDEYCDLLDTHSEPWYVLDLIKDVPRIWKDEQIQKALERAVPRIADGIRTSVYPLDIVRTLLLRDSMEHIFTDTPWVFRHEELSKAIRESTDRMRGDIKEYNRAMRTALQLALDDARMDAEDSSSS
ncbi:MAG: hypothetical protein ACFFE2_07585 [Candidatus Thorarchaeota archaeon]